VLQGYGATETGTGSCTTLEDHGLCTVGRPPEVIEMRLADDGEVQFHGATLFQADWNAPELTAAAFTEDGWYKTGDIGHLDSAGRLILSGRMRDIIVLPNGFNVYPEDIENALRIAGLRDSVVLETAPGRIEAILLAPAAGPIRTAGETLDFDPAAPPPELRASIDAAVKSANATLGPNQRVAGWRLWPESDFPRTHTLKVKRNLVRAWVGAVNPL
jgi:long-chain acyl-CoA synthetase